jgi:histidyl-tRNA synthetase
MWRYSRPQTGRLREFRQFGVEVLGSDSPNADVETMSLGWQFLKNSGVRGLSLEVNTLGDSRCRPRYRNALIEYLSARQGELTDEHGTSLVMNPLRVLYRRVKTLVRGLDYYVRTAFEFVSKALPPGQESVGGGGRYDGLAEMLSLPRCPGVGFAIGLERVLLSQTARRADRIQSRRRGLFVVAFGPDARVIGRKIVSRSRRWNLSAQMTFDERPLGTQLKSAGRSQAEFAVIIGPEELARAAATVRDLVTGSQSEVSLSELLVDPRVVGRDGQVGSGDDR